MDKIEVIAERKLLFVDPDGREILSSVQFGRPYENTNHGYCCDFEIPSVEKRGFAAGVDGIQAILLSMLMVASHLDVKRDHGWKILWPDTRVETSAREIFSADLFVRLMDGA